MTKKKKDYTAFFPLKSCWQGINFTDGTRVEMDYMTGNTRTVNHDKEKETKAEEDEGH